MGFLGGDFVNCTSYVHERFEFLLLLGSIHTWVNGTSPTSKHEILYIKATVAVFICLSVWTKLQVSRNEGSVCLGTWRQEVSSIMGQFVQ